MGGLQQSKMPKNTATARERELYRYYQPEEISGVSEPDSNGVPVTPRSSNDPILTAFAQLGALRLNVKRGLITLSTNCKEYIIAESGQSLSLQKDDDEQDRLWHGIGQISCTAGGGPELASIFCTAGESLTHLAINDLTKDEQFCEKDIVVGPPYARFLACVPLRTPHYGVVIGTYIVVDDKPRDGLNECELQFLMDMGVTVMDYLEAGLVKRKQHRAARMVKAMGLFIEGKATLRDWWLELGHKSQNIAVKKRNKNIASLKRQADVEFGVQDPTDDFARKGLNGLPDHHERPSWSRSPSSSAFSIAERNDGRPGLPPGASHISSSDRDTTVQSTPISQAWNDRNSSITTFGTPTEPTTDSGDREKHNSVSFDLPPDTSASSHVSKELQDAVLSGDLKGVFARASNLIREAIGVEGVVYFDASVGSFGGSATRNVMDEKAPGAFNPGNLVTSSEDDFSRKMSVSVSDVDGFLHAMSSAQETDSTPPEKCCNILGFSTRHRSSLRGHPTSEELRCLPETIIRRLLKRYPHGKVFNFDEDGQMSSESEYTSGIETPAESESLQPTPIELKARRKRQSRESEAKAILKVVPGARSVFWFPLWDQNRDRWFAGSLVWSTSPTRVLCPVEDITYLAAFGNSTMAEVSRLSAQLLAQMKTDFISSISHELRSPLHGVLASVEFLQETDMTEVQTDMVNNIHASGKVLLDTINHVLDFSKVNRRSKDKGRISKRAAKRLKRSRQPTGEDGAATDDNADVCILSEEVIESIYAGHRVSKHAFGSSAERHPSIAEIKDSPVTIIVEIPWRPNWTFDIDAGAWRRILMNLFSNAMKYTKSGFIKISLDVEEDVASRGKRQRSNLILKVKDSGKGISQEFLKHQLFRPFKQEDSLASGAGLGLSIIRHIIQDLGGNIDFSSEQGTGTEATVRIPLIAPNPSANADWETITEVRRHTTGLKFSLEGFERMPDISETPDGILSSDFEAAMLLKSTSNRILLGWFDMTPASPAPTGIESPDVIVIMEAGLKGKTLQDTLEPYSRNRAPGSKKATAVILCNTYHPGSKTESDENFNIYHLQQPYGPHKLAKIFHKAFCQKQENGVVTELELQQRKPQNDATEIPIQVQLPPITSPTVITPGSDILDFASPILEAPLRPKATLWQKPSSQETVTVKAKSPPTQAPAEPEQGGMRVLLVEDNEINLKLLVAYMRKLKLEHATATNGLEAVNAYKECEGNFDVIFMDISMPIMDGIESTQHIRRFEREKGLVPVALIALTGAANPSTRQEAFSSGVDLFLTKPVPMKELKVMLEDLRKSGREGIAGDGVFDG